MTHKFPPRARAGITLTEILISILIMGVGMLSLATLFPLGLQRLREASRSSRSALLIETATGDMAARDLLYKRSFLVNGYLHDPFTEDPSGAAEATAVATGLDRLPNTNAYVTGVTNGTKFAGGPGIPVCYDPMWWHEVYVASGGTISPSLVSGSDYRFGSGIGLIRDDGNSAPSAHGLQRLTNFPLASDPSSVFCSQDDIVMQTDGVSDVDIGRGSPIVPDLSTVVDTTTGIRARLQDYSFTWIFTGKQTDVANGTVFDGDIVVFHNRPFAPEQSGGTNRAAGETVVEAIWGYSTTQFSSAEPYGTSDTRVLLRWPNTQADPDVRVGGWISDVTYERYSSTEVSRWYPSGLTTYYPAQRCYWYRVAKKGEVTSDSLGMDSSYRQMVVTLAAPVRAKTPINTNGQPSHVNAALVSPYVVNVVSRVFYSR